MVSSFVEPSLFLSSRVQRLQIYVRKGYENTTLGMLNVSETFHLKCLECWTGGMSWWVRAPCGKQKDLSSNPQSVLKRDYEIFNHLKLYLLPRSQTHH